MDKGNSQDTPSAQPLEGSAEARLDSWKAIGAYLKRDVRTLRRWEQREGLPVHRHVHDKQATIYAYKAELDAWWNTRRPIPKAEQERGKEAAKKRKRWAGAALGAALAVAVGVALWLPQPRALPFAERDWVLIAQFENRTGEAVFDDTLEYALERQLSNSRFVNVIPRVRIEDSLRLMKKPLDTRVDKTLGREVCLRDGAIRALLTGRVEKLDHTYLLSAALVNPADGATVASFSERADGQKAVVGAVRRLANQVRETLGEKLMAIQDVEQKLVKVTTPSLRALRLYSEADSVIARGPRAYDRIAEQLLKQAIAEDPEFASAFTHLAHALRNQGRPSDEYLPHAKTAVELADRLPDRERYFIHASNYSMRGEFEKAAASYEALLRVYPDHYWATGNLAALYASLNQFEKSVPYVLQRADLRPNSFVANAAAAQVLVQWADDPAQAQAYLQRARALLSPEAERASPRSRRLAAWLPLLSAHTHWLQGEVDKALSEVTRAGETAKARSGPEGQVLAGWVAGTYLMLGKLRVAEEIFRGLPDTPGRRLQLSLVALARGDEPAVREHLIKSAEPSSFKVLVLARAGLLREAEEVRQALLGLDQRYPVCAAARDKIMLGELALARGETAQALRLLEDGVGVRPSCSLSGSASLARTLGQQGEWQRALRVLEEAAQDRNVYSMNGGWPGLFWLRIQWQRAQLLRQVGRDPEAREVEAELLKLLADADADHAIVVELSHLSQQEAVRVAEAP